MKDNSHKTRFWTVLATVNSLTLLLPVVFLLQADNDPMRLLGILATYGTAFLLFIADTVSICCSYFMDS